MSGTGDGAKQPIFRDLNADDAEQETTEVESLCLVCGHNGTTRLLLTKIPYFKEIILSSFSCPNCGNSNREAQFGGRIQDKGTVIEFLVKEQKDLNRQVVKSDYSSVTIPELDLEIPARSQKGEITTVEGILDRVVNGLKQDQVSRQLQDPNGARKVEDYIERLQKTKELRTPFHLIIDDPSGNSFVENPFAPHKDYALVVTTYVRSQEHIEQLGFSNEDRLPEIADSDSDVVGEVSQDEVLTFKTNCSNCNSPCDTNMKRTKIPHFKEVVIMATNCEACGHRTNEVKSGAGFEPQGVHITLNLTCQADLNRDVLKSETCSVHIPELELDVGGGTFGGRFTTVEGLLENIKQQLKQANPLITGDSGDPDRDSKMDVFLNKLDKVRSGELPAHLILDDPAGNSYLQNIYAPESDPEMQVVQYDRTFEQNEELGLNDMRTENY